MTTIAFLNGRSNPAAQHTESFAVGGRVPEPSAMLLVTLGGVAALKRRLHPSKTGGDVNVLSARAVRR